jgi:hypothetical protein
MHKGQYNLLASEDLHSTDMIANQDEQAQLAVHAATDSGAATNLSGAEDIWDEQQIEDALKVLKEMHIQVSSATCP